MEETRELVLEVEELEERIAPSKRELSAWPVSGGNPAQAPGNSNPNEHPGG